MTNTSWLKSLLIKKLLQIYFTITVIDSVATNRRKILHLIVSICPLVNFVLLCPSSSWGTNMQMESVPPWHIGAPWNITFLVLTGWIWMQSQIILQDILIKWIETGFNEEASGREPIAIATNSTLFKRGTVPLGAPNYGQANSSPCGTISVPVFLSVVLVVTWKKKVQPKWLYSGAIFFTGI